MIIIFSASLLTGDGCEMKAMRFVMFADIGLILDQMTKSQAAKLKLHAFDSPAKTGLGASLEREWSEVKQSWNFRARC